MKRIWRCMMIISIRKGLPNIMFLIRRVTWKLKREKKTFKDKQRMLWKGLKLFSFELNIPRRSWSVKKADIGTFELPKPIRTYSLRKVNPKHHTSFISWNSIVQNGSAYLEIFDTQESEVLEIMKEKNRHWCPFEPTSNVYIKY